MQRRVGRKRGRVEDRNEIVKTRGRVELSQLLVAHKSTGLAFAFVLVLSMLLGTL